MSANQPPTRRSRRSVITAVLASVLIAGVAAGGAVTLMNQADAAPAKEDVHLQAEHSAKRTARQVAADQNRSRGDQPIVEPEDNATGPDAGGQTSRDNATGPDAGGQTSEDTGPAGGESSGDELCGPASGLPAPIAEEDGAQMLDITGNGEGETMILRDPDTGQPLVITIDRNDDGSWQDTVSGSCDGGTFSPVS